MFVKTIAAARWTLLTIVAIAAVPLTAQQPKIEPQLVAELQYAPGNIAVTPEGRVFMSLFGGYNPPWKLAELVDGELKPYPDAAWASEPVEGSDVGIYSVLGLRSDQNGTLWLLDHGSRGRNPASLVAWDTRSESLYKRIAINPPYSGSGMFLNDLAVDSTHNQVFVAVVSDPPHILSINTETGAMRQLLVDDPSMQSEGIPVVLQGRELGNFNRDGQIEPRQGGLNPITIDSQNEWLYYGAMTGASLYRVRVNDLLDESLSADRLSARVERYADKVPSAGLTMDDAGNVYVTDLGGQGIGVTNSAGEYRLLFSDERIEWPDGMAIGPDSQVYFNINQQNRGTDSHRIEGGAAPPFYIFRFNALAEASPGR